MKLKVIRFSSQKDSTSGLLFEENEYGIKFICYTLEDEKREEKVRGETRVPAGKYKLALRKEGGFHSRYSKKFSDHKGMLCLYNKPNWTLENAGMSFQYILIHTGNTDEHTAGCLLLNDVVDASKFTGSYSTQAYKRIYPKIADYIEECGPVQIIVE